MFEISDHFPLIVLILGILIFFSITIKTFFHEFYLAPVAGYIALGWLLKMSESKWAFLPKGMEEILGFFGEIGIITILFHVGLDSHIKCLMRQIRRASYLAFSNTLVSGLLVFFVSYNLLSISFVSSLFIGVALTATSLAVVVTIWHDSNSLETKDGQLLIDLTALDDIIAIILMALLLAVAPLIGNEGIAGMLIYTFSVTVLKLIFFFAICMVFSFWVEPKLMSYLRQFERSPDPLVTIISVGFIIAGISALLGFSLALGAFFAGLAFSRDPDTMCIEAPIIPIEAFFAPFFFINIGFQVFPGVMKEASMLGAVLLCVAVVGKLFGVMLPALSSGMRLKSAWLIGISMIPRAEIALVVMMQGMALGAWAVSPHIYASIVIVSFVTCLVTPIVLRPMLKS